MRKRLHLDDDDDDGALMIVGKAQERQGLNQLPLLFKYMVRLFGISGSSDVDLI